MVLVNENGQEQTLTVEGNRIIKSPPGKSYLKVGEKYYKQMLRLKITPIEEDIDKVKDM